MRAPEFWLHDAASARLLEPLGRLYAVAGRFRQARARPVQAPVPVLCVGNLTAGGSGKTPVVISIARRLIAQGRRPHVVTRGYGGRARGPLRVQPGRHGAEEVGDEALLLAAVAPTWVARRRSEGALAAAEAGADLVILDDGHQHPGLVKDLSLVVIDGEIGFGNGRLLPAGPLREPVAEGLARASGVVLMGVDRAGVRAALPERLPLLRAELRPPAGDVLTGRRVVAFAGIGRPRKFFATLEQLGAELLAARAFADHHRYRRREVEALLALASERRALAVTTAKDGVRLPPDVRPRVAVVPIDVAWQDAAALDRTLAPLLRSRAAHRIMKSD